MNHPLWTSPPFVIRATAAPPRDRTSRIDKALEHCKDEWQRAFDLATEKGHGSQKALRMAQVAYKLAMPRMADLPSIRAYISCIAQGVQLEVFEGRDGSQLLYAAQVALATLKPKGKKRAATPPPSTRTDRQEPAA